MPRPYVLLRVLEVIEAKLEKLKRVEDAVREVLAAIEQLPAQDADEILACFPEPTDAASETLPFGGSHAPDCPYHHGGECLCWRSDPKRNPELSEA